MKESLSKLTASSGQVKSDVSVEDQAKIKHIQQVIRQEGDNIRAKYPILANQNLMGMSIFLLSVFGIAASGWGYLEGHLSAWVSIPLAAFFMSLLHELEHDLIHWQYFKNQKVIHHFMLAVGWILRPGTINPWVRRQLHFLHHKVSGTDHDIEERGISNGMKLTPLRVFVMLDTLTGNILKALLRSKKDAAKHKASKLKTIFGIIVVNFPLGFLCVAVWYSFLGFHLANGIAYLMGDTIAWSAATLENMVWIEQLVVVIVAPFYIRSFSINFISSNMHYYGNVNSLLEQTQVLNHPIFLPFNLFCFNFGSSHGIHHFVVKEPFYIRQLTVKAAHKVMKENGVRFNEFGTFKRANNYLQDKPATEAALASS